MYRDVAIYEIRRFLVFAIAL